MKEDKFVRTNYLQALNSFFRFINSLGYFGILFSTPTLSGDMFVNLVLSGAVEIPACFICMFALERYVFPLSDQKGMFSYQHI